MEFLGYLSGGFVALIFVSLLMISVGFLWDSSQASAEPSEQKPPSRLMLLVLTIFYALLGYYWTRNLLQQIAKAEPDWFITAMSAFWVALCVLEFFRNALAAIRYERSVDISP